MLYKISYAGGKKFSLSGTFKISPPIVPGSILWTPYIQHDAEHISLLDPRAIVKDATGKVVFRGCTTEDLERDLNRCNQ
jgi:hypothetical protein